MRPPCSTAELVHPGIHRFTGCGIRPPDFQGERTGQGCEPAPLQFRSTEDAAACAARETRRMRIGRS